MKAITVLAACALLGGCMTSPPPASSFASPATASTAALPQDSSVPPPQCRANWSTNTGTGNMEVPRGGRCQLEIIAASHSELLGIQITETPKAIVATASGARLYLAAPTTFSGTDNFTMKLIYKRRGADATALVRFSVTPG